jgi:copper chaperone CopZ
MGLPTMGRSRKIAAVRRACSVTRAVTAAAPGAKVSVDLKSGEVVIDGANSRQAVVAAIEDAGYDVVGEAA